MASRYHKKAISRITPEQRVETMKSMGLRPYDIKIIISDLKDTVQTIDEYLEKKKLTHWKKEILQALFDTQEIVQCSNCDSWQELGEMYPEQLCEGCYHDSGDERVREELE